MVANWVIMSDMEVKEMLDLIKNNRSYNKTIKLLCKYYMSKEGITIPDFGKENIDSDKKEDDNEKNL